LHLLGFTAEATSITASLVATASAAACPVCGHPSARIHSRYIRRVSDLPWHGVAVRLDLHVHRFFCDQPTCPRQIFTQRLPGVVAPYARRTERLQAWFTAVGFAAGGEAGVRLLRALGLTTSADTLVRQIRRTPLAQRPTPRVLSVDDWSRRRGQTYGTLLVDLEAHRPVEVLPDRSAATFARWLEQHPGVEVVCRDRGGSYADGARQGAPHAVQVADRWHVVKNLMDALERGASREQRTLRAAAHAVAVAVASASSRQPTGPLSAMGPDVALSRRVSRQEHQRSERHAHRRARYEAVQHLQTKGVPLTQIAQELALDRSTVRRYAHATSCPERAERRGQPSALAPFRAYLQERWEAGEHNAQHLLAKLRSRGYTGSSTILYTLLAPWRSRPYERRGGQARRTTRVHRLSPRQTAWLLVKPSTEQSAEEQRFVQDVLERSALLAYAQQLVTTFFTVVHTRRRAVLEEWLCPRPRPAASSIWPDSLKGSDATSQPWQQA